MSHSDSENLSIVANGLDETARIGTAIGNALTPGMVVGLNGTLGAGKTTVTQSIGVALGCDLVEIVSPTFTICVPHTGRVRWLHLDAYRITSDTEVDELGLDEEQEDGTVILVEWADRIEHVLPPLDLRIAIELGDEHVRHFQLKPLTAAGVTLTHSVKLELAQHAS